MPYLLFTINLQIKKIMDIIQLPKKLFLLCFLLIYPYILKPYHFILQRISLILYLKINFYLYIELLIHCFILQIKLLLDHFYIYLDILLIIIHLPLDLSSIHLLSFTSLFFIRILYFKFRSFS